MSLATTCPQCRTSFKVVPDQLKLRRGQVRCGVCQHVFSGLDSLRYVQADNGAATMKAPDLAKEPDTTTSDATRAPDRTAAAAESIAIRSGTSASIDAEAQPQADPFIDVESITSQDSPDPRSATVEPTLGAPSVRTDAPTTEPDTQAFPSGDTAPPPDTDAEPVATPDTQAFTDRDTGMLADRDTGTLADRDTETFTDRDTETLADRDRDREEPAAGDTMVRTNLDLRLVDEPPVRDTLPLDDAGSAFDTLARDLEGTGPRASQPEFAEPAEPRSDDAPTVSAPVARAATTTERTLQTAHARPAENSADDNETDAVDFFSTQRSARGFSTRGTLLSAFASIVLAALLAAQGAIGARDWLAAHYPALRPAIAAAIGPLGLEIAAPRALESLTIEGFELQSTPVAGLYSLNALLRNGADHDVRWPAMELTLNDQAGAVVVRKVLMPADYLPGASVRSVSGSAPAAGATVAAATPAAIAPAVEISLRAALEASGVEPTGYTVKLFYP